VFRGHVWIFFLHSDVVLFGPERRLFLSLLVKSGFSTTILFVMLTSCMVRSLSNVGGVCTVQSLIASGAAQFPRLS
jgi:hypothetical protein